jgi:hypothetical protein
VRHSIRRTRPPVCGPRRRGRVRELLLLNLRRGPVVYVLLD